MLGEEVKGSTSMEVWKSSKQNWHVYGHVSKWIRQTSYKKPSKLIIMNQQLTIYHLSYENSTMIAYEKEY